MSEFKQTLALSGRLPGLNEMLAAARQHRHKSNAYALMKKRVEHAVWTQIKRRGLIPVSKGRLVYLEFGWTEPDRRRDKDNIAAGRKFILDALVRAGVLAGDGWADIAGFSDVFAVDPGASGVTVTIREVL